MAKYFSNPTVDGNLGILTRNIRLLTSDEAQPTFTAGKTAVIAELEDLGIRAGDLVHATWVSGAVDFCLVIDETGLKLQKFALVTA